MIKKIFELLISFNKTGKKLTSKQRVVEVKNHTIPTNDIEKNIPGLVIESSKGQSLLPNSLIVKKLREIIGDEFKLGASGDCLNCTEYVQFKIKQKLGTDIKWPPDRPRNGGKWAEIFQKHGLYKILDTPKIWCAVSFTDGISSNPNINAIGHVAFVEKVNDDGSIEISEANWPNQGKYNERRLEKWQWQNKYKCRFIDFS